MLSDGRHSYIHKNESNASMLSRVIFYLKSVTFLFLFSLFIRVLKNAQNFYEYDFFSSYHIHQCYFMYRFFIITAFVLCMFKDMHVKCILCIAHDIIYDSAYTIFQVRHHGVLTVYINKDS